MLAQESPTITDWLQGIGTILAAPIAAIAVLLTVRTLRSEIRLRRDAEATAARLVLPDVTTISMSRGRPTAITWTVNNHGTAPIFDVRARIRAGERHVDSDLALSVVTQHAEQEIVLPEQGGMPGHLNLDGLSIEVTFTDAAGLVWQRRDRRIPERIVQVHDGRESAWWLLLVAAGCGAVAIVLSLVALLAG
ncbi:hypothetical protein [Actinoplanes sp. CA-252034]|uniref:hypothetical protein n=1 Tax=Actinoplanes sp. CA-252034 TaxID=3239906 RepID=UPI003D98A9B2